MDALKIIATTFGCAAAGTFAGMWYGEKTGKGDLGSGIDMLLFGAAGFAFGAGAGVIFGAIAFT